MKQKIKKMQSKKKRSITYGILLCILLMLMIGIIIYKQQERNNAQIEYPAQLNDVQQTSIYLGNDMYITDVGKYSGIYMEDGSNEIVSDVMMICVKNKGKKTIQYAEISVPVGDKTGSFVLSTLPPDSTVIVLEKNKMSYEKEDYTIAVAQNVAVFSNSINLCEESLDIQSLDGIINVKNISGDDIKDDIVIYYKYSSIDALYGGITYRIRIEGGLKKDEVRQIAASHFSEVGSKIMFVTIGMQ